MNTTINIDINLRNQLVMDYMPLVRTIAGRYHIPTVPREDLEQEGALALILALDSYDISSQVPFEAYAIPRINKAVLTAIATIGRPIRVPRNRATDFPLVPVSLDTPMPQFADDDDVPTLAESIPDDAISIEDRMMLRLVDKRIDELILNLRPRQRQILSMAYAIDANQPLNCNRIARQLQLHPVYVRQTLSEAILSVRKVLKPLH